MFGSGGSENELTRNLSPDNYRYVYRYVHERISVILHDAINLSLRMPVLYPHLIRPTHPRFRPANNRPHTN